MRTIAHVTHEAIHKFGGIGTVLEGLLTSRPYRERNDRTLLIGPLPPGDDRRPLGDGGEVVFNNRDRISLHPAGDALARVCRHFQVDIVFGRREFFDAHSGVRTSPEVALIDVSRMDHGRVNDFKGKLWSAYAIDSRRYESCYDYELYVRLAEPALAVLHAVNAAKLDAPCVVLAHEYMGMPTALAARLDPTGVFKTVFYAHEVSVIRRIVEELPGHDVAFYNALEQAAAHNRYLTDVFGLQDHYYRHALVEASRFCDAIFAVGDNVARELRFLRPEFHDANIRTTYNGVPSERITLEQKRSAKRRLQDYAERLLGDRPDLIFTHVTRTTVSKGLWRDLHVLEHLEAGLRRTGRTAVMFLLSTEVPQRSPKDIRHMERWWDWPVSHREVAPDLTHGEALVYQGIQAFNARSRQIKAVYVNQFGWSREVCGDRMPADVSFADLRRGADVEFGLSVYEPFGIAPFEPLTFGALCAVSDASGCAFFADRVRAGRDVPNLIVADYSKLDAPPADVDDLLDMDRDARTVHERRVAADVARRILGRLPASDAEAEALLAGGFELARQMSWDVVAGQNVLPPIDDICRESQRACVA